jgi:cell division protein FtsZ
MIQEQAHPEARVIWGLVFDDSMEDRIRITVIATGFEEKLQVKDEIEESLKRVTLFGHEDLPPFMRKNLAVDYKETKKKSEKQEFDEDRYDIPTFMRKQAD